MSEPKVKKSKKEESQYIVLMPDVIPFGKYKNKSFDDMFYSMPVYFQWLQKQEWLHDELRKNLEKYISDMKINDLVKEYEDKKLRRQHLIAKAKENAEKLEQKEKKEGKTAKKK
jgi:uncharacterized protein (DUF3820 family)